MYDEIKKILEIKEDCDYKKISVDALTTLREYFDRLTLSFYSSSDENNRLNNIIDELEKWLRQNLVGMDNTDDIKKIYTYNGRIDCINKTLDKLKELKGDSSNE